jgi:CBS domain containing-hemolysin-like protein
MDNVGLSLFAVVLLLAANAFFVAAEFALVKARGFRLETYAGEGSAAARLTLRIQANLEAYLAACQLGITMASLGLGWVGEPAVAALLEPLFHWAGVPDVALHTVSFLVGFLLFSSLHIVIGEQVPKTLAIRRAERVSVWTAYPLHVAYLAVFPLNWLLNVSARSILRWLRVDEVSHVEVLSGEEIKGLVSTSREHGEIDHGKAAMLHNLFEFDQRQVGRVMIPRSALQVLDVTETPEHNLEIIRDSGHSRFPTIDSGSDDELLGVVLSRDLYIAMLSGNREPWKALKEFCREPLVVPESQKLAQLFEAMRADRAHMACVVDEYGELTGIVTLEDLLEEIVGEIRDETDLELESDTVVELGDGQWLADGLLSLADLERAIGLKVPAELDANTLSGLFMARLGRMPEVNDSIEEADFRLTVRSLEDRRVCQVAIGKIAETEDLSAEAGKDST